GALDKSFTSGIIPARFRDLVGCYWNDALRISHLYTRAIIATRKLGLPTVNDDNAIEAFKQSIQALKRGKIRGSFDGYFYGTVYQMTAAAHRRAENRRTLFDYAVLPMIPARNMQSEPDESRKTASFMPVLSNMPLLAYSGVSQAF